MKGFGAFVIASILMSSLALMHASRMREAEVSAYEVVGSSQSFEKIGFLRNVLKKSHEKLSGPDSAWRIAVLRLAEYYEVDVLIDGQRVVLVDSRNAVRSEFYLR